MNQYKLLLVDDEAIERDAIKFILSKFNMDHFEIHEAPNGQEAVSQAALIKPDIIIMDIQMPGLNGIESSKIIKKILPDCKIVFLTAYDQFEYAHEAIKLGVDDFLIKPASNERFVDVMMRTVEAINNQRNLMKQQEEMESKLEKVTEYLEQEFVSAIISGNLAKGQAEDYMEFYGLNDHYGMGIAIHLYFDEEESSSEIRNQMMKKRFLQHVEGGLVTLSSPIFTSISQNFLYLLVFNKDDVALMQNQQIIRKAIEKTGDFFSENYATYSDFCFGDVFKDPTKLWKSFSKARAGSNKQISGDSTVYKERLNALIKGIQTKDDSVIAYWIDTYIQSLNLGEETIERVRIQVYEQVILIINSLKDIGIIYPKSSQLVFGEIMTLENRAQIRQLLVDLVEQSIDQLKETETDKTTALMNKLITYINSHYNENITLDQLSDMCGLSTFYLSKVFKKHVDMNFSDYISFIRINVAKRLLKNPEMSMKEISSEVGYQDPNYFARVFKKIEKVTPTHYRNIQLHLEDKDEK